MKILVTGVSSGLGRELTRNLVSNGHSVVGVARRKKLLETLKKEMPSRAKFNFIEADLVDRDVWEDIIKILKKLDFVPDVVIFNAATWEKKLVREFNFESLEQASLVNYMSVMKGVSQLIPYLGKKKTQFIAISTLSALWGSAEEGVGYPASKSALSIAFEGLYQKFKNTNFTFTTVSFGPIKASSNSFMSFRPLQISLKDAAGLIEEAVNGKKAVYFAPPLLFFCFGLLRLLPTNLKLRTFSLINNFHPYHLHNN